MTRPFRVDWAYLDKLEDELSKIFRRHLYAPIKKIFIQENIVTNATELEKRQREQEKEMLAAVPGLETVVNQKLIAALRSGRIQFWADRFTGRFDAQTSREIMNLGGIWRPAGGFYYLPYNKLPQDVKTVINFKRDDFTKRMEDADRKLSKISGVQVAAAIGAGFLLGAILRSEKDFQSVVKSAEQDQVPETPPPTAAAPEGEKEVPLPPLPEVPPKELPPTPTDEDAPATVTRKMVSFSEEWEKTMKFNIARWSDEEVRSMRKNLKGLIDLNKNYDKEGAPKNIEKYIYDRYGATICKTIFPGKQLEDLTKEELSRIEAKAQFIARNEVRLMSTAYKYDRSMEDGYEYFLWVSVADNPQSPVRPSHKDIRDRVWRFDDPPLDWQLGLNVLPGQAYNCRCTAVPIKSSQIATDANGKPRKKTDGSYITI